MLAIESKRPRVPAAARRIAPACQQRAPSPASSPPPLHPCSRDGGSPPAPRSSRWPLRCRGSPGSGVRSSARASSATAAASAFTIASQIPNFQQPVLARGPVGGVRAGVHRADAAGPQARGVPARLVAVLADPGGAGGAHRCRSRSRPAVMPLFTGVAERPVDGLTAGLVAGAVPGRPAARPDGLVVGILQAYDHFTIPAIAPAVWNVVIIVGLVALHAGGSTATTRSTPTRSACWWRPSCRSGVDRRCCGGSTSASTFDWTAATRACARC